MQECPLHVQHMRVENGQAGGLKCICSCLYTLQTPGPSPNAMAE